MTLRELTRAEWATKLAGTELELAVPVLPADSRVLVVEDAAGAVIGAWAVLRYVHVEGLWIAPAHRRRGRVLARLLEGMRRVVRSWGTEAALTAAATPEVRALITKYGGVALPEHFVFHIEGTPCRP